MPPGSAIFGYNTKAVNRFFSGSEGKKYPYLQQMLPQKITTFCCCFVWRILQWLVTTTTICYSPRSRGKCRNYIFLNRLRMLEGLVSWFLNNYLGTYLENVDTHQLSISLLQVPTRLFSLKSPLNNYLGTLYLYMYLYIPVFPGWGGFGECSAEEGRPPLYRAQHWGSYTLNAFKRSNYPEMFPFTIVIHWMLEKV